MISMYLCSPRLWWRFAIKSVHRTVIERSQRLSVRFILGRARQCTRYVAAYTQHLTSYSVPQGVNETLEEVELELGYEELVVLRRVAMQRIERERALAEVCLWRTFFAFFLLITNLTIHR